MLKRTWESYWTEDAISRPCAFSVTKATSISSCSNRNWASRTRERDYSLLLDTCLITLGILHPILDPNTTLTDLSKSSRGSSRQSGGWSTCTVQEAEEIVLFSLRRLGLGEEPNSTFQHLRLSTRLSQALYWGARCEKQKTTVKNWTRTFQMV